MSVSANQRKHFIPAQPPHPQCEHPAWRKWLADGGFVPKERDPIALQIVEQIKTEPEKESFALVMLPMGNQGALK